MSESKRSDIYQTVTNRIVAALESGVRPWMQPWGSGATARRPLRVTGQPYRGINTVLLWMETQEKGYASPYWMTYRQAQERGGQVRKGERSTIVVYAGAIERTEEGENGEEVERKIPFLKSYCVFNADQIEDLPERYRGRPVIETPKKERIERADAFFAATKADIREGGNRAFYSPAADFIQMPPFDAFVSAEAHATTLAHELIHWTKAPDRLDRSFGVSRFGNEAYSAEEVVAELGSAYVAADLDLEIEPRDDHAAYIESWLRAMKRDKRFIFQAAAHAQRAADFLHGLQPVAADDNADNHPDNDDEHQQAA